MASNMYRSNHLSLVEEREMETVTVNYNFEPVLSQDAQLTFTLTPNTSLMIQLGITYLDGLNYYRKKKCIIPNLAMCQFINHDIDERADQVHGVLEAGDLPGVYT